MMKRCRQWHFENREISCLSRSNIAVHSNSDNRSVLCANCKTESAHRSHRHGVVEAFVSLFAYYPYSCRECKHRFLHRRAQASDASLLANRSTEREIRATRNAKNWRRKRVELVIYGTALLLFVVVIYFITRARSAPDAGWVPSAAPVPQFRLAQSLPEGVALRALDVPRWTKV
jgi:hypothetical protein